MDSKYRTLGKLFYRIFILSQLCFAIFFTNQSIQSWRASPVVISGMFGTLSVTSFKKSCFVVDTKSVKEISFPAVSVCHPVSWTWPSITNLFSDLDVRGSIITSLLAQDPDLLRGGLSTRQESTNCTFDLEETASFSDLIQNEYPIELGYMNHFFGSY